MAKIDHLKLENRIQVLRGYTELWQTYFQYFSDDLAEKQITEEMERDFENIVGLLALNHYKFVELCGDYVKDSGDVLKILSETVSLESVRVMAEATLSKLLLSWHTLFLEMNKGLGKMLAKLPPKALAAMQAAQQGGQPQH